MTFLSHELNTSAATDGSVSTPHLPDRYAPSELYTPAKLRDATMEEYIEFLQNYLEKGGKITNLHDIPFSYMDIKTVTTSGTVKDGSVTNRILVPEGIEILPLKSYAGANVRESTICMQDGACTKATYGSYKEIAVPLPRQVARAMGWNFKVENFEDPEDFEKIQYYQQEEFIAAQNGTTIPLVEAEKGDAALYPASIEDEAEFMIKYLEKGGHRISGTDEDYTSKVQMAMCSATVWKLSKADDMDIIVPEGIDINFVGSGDCRVRSMKDGSFKESGCYPLYHLRIQRPVAEKMMEMGFKFKKHHFVEDYVPRKDRGRVKPTFTDYKTVKRWEKEARWKKPAVEAKNTAPALPAQKTTRAVFNDVVREGNKLTYVDQNCNPLVTGTVDENGKKHGIWEHMQINGRGRFVCFNHGDKVDAAAHLEELIQNPEVANIVLAQEADDSCASAVLGAGSLLRDAQESLASINRMEQQEQQKVWEPHY